PAPTATTSRMSRARRALGPSGAASFLDRLWIRNGRRPCDAGRPRPSPRPHSAPLHDFTLLIVLVAPSRPSRRVVVPMRCHGADGGKGADTGLDGGLLRLGRLRRRLP